MRLGLAIGTTMLAIGMLLLPFAENRDDDELGGLAVALVWAGVVCLITTGLVALWRWAL